MADIFISYAREDEEKIRPLVHALEAHGWSVFWDRRIPAGKTWRSFVGDALHQARCVIAAWSSQSVGSKWVTEEADEGLRRGILVPVLLEPVDPPMGFRSIQAADLHDWQPAGPSPQFAQFIQDVSVTLGAAPGTPRAASITTTAPPGARRREMKPAMIAAAGAVVVLAVAFLYWKLGSDATSGEPNAATPAAASAPGAAPIAGANTARDPVPANTSAPAPTAPAPGAPEAAARGDGFALTIGARVSDGVPGEGAGIIAKEFEQDLYRFTAAPRQTVFFRLLEISPSLLGSYLGWRLVHEDGTEVFNRGFYTGHPGVVTLIKGGNYTLTVGSTTDRAIGMYQFQLFNVPPPDQFNVQIGSKIQDGQPGPGAGYIESPGAKDVYTFTAEPRQKVYFRVHGASPVLARSYVGWRLVDADGTELFNQGFYTGDPGIHTLIKGGVYTLTVGSNTDPGTGTYEVSIGKQD